MPLTETREKNAVLAVSSGNQKTIAKSVSIAGVGLFSGKAVTMTFHPSDQDGIFFKREDLPGKPVLRASVDNLKGTPRCTILGNDQMVVQCVEHVLSAVFAAGVDRLVIALDAEEPPIIDGSSIAFVSLIEEAGMVETSAPKISYSLKEIIHLQEKDMDIIALPSPSLKYSYTLSYPGVPLLDSQFYSFDFATGSYKQEIAPCRTFAPLSEVQALIDCGLINSDNPEGGVILDGEKVLNKDGLRFSNEMVRHKILDVIGDLSLVTAPVTAHYIAIRSGHYLNTMLSARLKNLIEEAC